MEMKSYKLSKRFVQIETEENIYIKIDAGVTELIEAGKYVFDLIDMDAKVLNYTGNPKITERGYYINKKAESIIDIQETQIIKNEVPTLDVNISPSSNYVIEEKTANPMDVYNQIVFGYSNDAIYIKYNGVYQRYTYIKMDNTNGRMYFYVRRPNTLGSDIALNLSFTDETMEYGVMKNDPSKVFETYYEEGAESNVGIFAFLAKHNLSFVDVSEENTIHLTPTSMILQDGTKLKNLTTLSKQDTNIYKIYCEQGIFVMNLGTKTVTIMGVDMPIGTIISGQRIYDIE